MKLDDFKKECVKKGKELKLKVDKIHVSFSAWANSEYNENDRVQCCYYLKDDTTISFEGDTPEIAFLNLEHKIKIEEVRKKAKKPEPLTV